MIKNRIEMKSIIEKKMFIITIKYKIKRTTNLFIVNNNLYHLINLENHMIIRQRYQIDH